MPSFVSLFSALIALLVTPVLVQASGFGINATRLIYPQEARSISVTLRNTLTTAPYLVQVGVSCAQSGHVSAPFLVTPPLFRLEPGSVNQVRIAIQGARLPADRESVFYFQASAIPASTAPTSGNQGGGVHGTAQFGVGNIIKLFYRPADLPSSSTAAQQDLQFSRAQGGLQVSNPSPYFVSFASISVGGKKLRLDTSEALMLRPFGSHTYPATALRGPVKWQTINDEGGINAFSRELP